MNHRPLRRTAAGIFGLVVTLGSGAEPVRAAGPDVYGAEPEIGRVLPVDGSDLPLVTAAAASDPTTSFAPAVQAIPTPTALHGGLAALAVLGIARLARRRLTRSSAI